VKLWKLLVNKATCRCGAHVLAPRLYEPDVSPLHMSANESDSACGGRSQRSLLPPWRQPAPPHRCIVMALLSSFAGLRLREHAASTAELRVRSPCALTPRAACSVHAAAGGASSAERRERRHKIIRKKVRACAALRSARQRSWKKRWRRIAPLDLSPLRCALLVATFV